MADLYDIPTIKATILRVLGKDVTVARLKTELDTPLWVPELDRMIAVSDSMDDLDSSTRYGVFLGMSSMKKYKISSGRFNYARLLTPEEIAKCY